MDQARNRQERLHMRQRGANTRKIQTADFAFSFDPRRSRSRSASVARSINTPASRARQSSQTRSIRAGSASRSAKTAQSQRHQRGISISEDATASIAYSEPTPGNVLSQLAQTPSIALQSSRKRKRDTDVPVIIREDKSDDNDVDSLPTESEMYPTAERISTGKENTTVTGSSDTTAAFKTVAKQTQKRRKRKSIGQQRKKSRTSNSSVEDSTVTEEGQEESEAASTQQLEQSATRESSIPSEEAPNAFVNGSETNEQVAGKETEDETSEIAQTAPTTSPTTSSRPTRTRRKRKSIAQPRRKKRASTDSLPSRRQNLNVDETVIRSEIDDDDQSMFVPDVESSPMIRRKITQKPQVKHKRRADGTTQVLPSVENSGQQNRNSSEPRGQTMNARQRHSNPASIPIVVHRMTNPSALPTIHEEGEEGNSQGSDGDEPSRAAKHLKREDPNSIDVVAQLCRETIDSSLEKAVTSQDPTTTSTSRQILTRKQKTIESFGAELSIRLFNMSQALDHRSILEARLKRSKREKATVQNEWLSLRKRREEIAMKCDDVRRRNTEAERSAREAQELHEGLNTLEMALDREDVEEEAGPAMGLEFLLRTVAEDVSSKAGDGVGLLDRVRGFNVQLERTIMALEGNGL